MEDNDIQNKIEELQNEVAILKNDAEKYRLLKDTAGFTILTIRVYVIIDCNKKAEEVFGLPKDEILGKEPFMFSPKYQPDGVTSEEKAIAFIDKVQSGIPLRFEWVHLRSDGAHFYCDVSLNKVEVGGESLLQVILRDVSQEKLGKERLENQNKIIRHLNKKYQRQNDDYEKIVERLKAQQELNGAIFSAINDGVAVFSGSDILYVNEKMCYMTGYLEDSESAVELFNTLGYNLNVMKLPTIPGELEESWPRGINNNKFFRLQIIRIAETDGYLVHLTDYTEIKNVNKHIEESEYKFRSIFHSSTDGILLVGSNMTIKDVNATFEKRYFYTRTELAGVEIDTLLFNPAQGSFNVWMRKYADELSHLAEFDVIAGNAKELPVEVDCRRLKLGETEFYLVIIRDISYRKSFERKMLHRTIDAEETERKRIAANLHDELGPILSSLKLYNNILKNKEDDQLQYLAEQSEGLITEAVETVRLLSEDLSPVSLYKGGLEKAIQRRLNALSGFFQIRFESSLNQARFSEQIEINTYRVVNELINNTLKHSQASEICVKMLRSKTDLHIHFSDNGVGFQPDTGDISDDGRGVGNILGRLKSMNATYSFNSMPDKGVQYEIGVPLSDFSS